MMNLDPRPVANAILDIAESRCVELTNFSMNKVLFFAHADWLITQDKPLFKLTFEAWQFGPVMPVIYHQFKQCGSAPITSRATEICRTTGESVISSYRVAEIDSRFLEQVVDQYGRMSTSALYALSHAEGGAWDLVYNGDQGRGLGMAIPNDLIKKAALEGAAQSPRRGYVH